MRIKIFPKNLEILKNINQENKIPITSLVNSYIYEQLNEKSDLIKEFKSKLAKEQTEVKIRIYENEKKFLLESSKLTGTNSLNQEIRFRLLNTIYKKRFLSPNEMQTFYDLKYQIKMIGVNLNQISKKLNSNQQVNVDFLMESISKLDEKLNENLVEIKKVLNYTNSRTRA
ncbi:plasmid mobilization relaxosome protein MobC [Aliarcobacter butzleri]|uniref:plasmid mobilization relaxosome protein MobC n=1 Tax=Aliarcobacter butzleri TaxID=28197 RepID=UPI002B250A93|nr:plasmid mobilization relaxosome protein MobC [Aliarcobacter butzleri]